MIEVKDVTIMVGGKPLVTGLSFMAKDGQLTCVTGPEGSGKTTLLRTLMGFLPVTEGFVSVDGEQLTIWSAHAFRQFMAYIPQEAHLLARQLVPVEHSQCQADDYAVWDMLLPEVAPEQPPQPLSPDNLFKLEQDTLLQASDKPIVIADEPAALLPPELAGRLLVLLQEQARAGKTVLVASRNPLLTAHADRLIQLTNNAL